MSGSVKIVLDEGGPRGGLTWVVSVPVRRYAAGQRSLGVVAAAGEALAMFAALINRDAEMVGERLRAADPERLEG